MKLHMHMERKKIGPRAACVQVHVCTYIQYLYVRWGKGPQRDFKSPNMLLRRRKRKKKIVFVAATVGVFLSLPEWSCASVEKNIYIYISVFKDECNDDNPFGGGGGAVTYWFKTHVFFRSYLLFTTLRKYYAVIGY